MTHDKTEQRVGELLLEGALVTPGRVKLVQISHIPFMRRQREFFLQVTLEFIPPFLVKEADNQCLAVARMVINSGILTDQRGVEVAGWEGKWPERKRVVRLSILSKAYLQAITSNDESVLGNLVDGITCHHPISTTRAQGGTS
jgi:hypothetical protein